MNRRVLLVLVVAFALVIFTGCKENKSRNSNDRSAAFFDDAPSDPKELIVGTWVVAYECKDDEKYATKGDETIIFSADGTAYFSESEMSEIFGTTTYVWYIQGDYLTMGDQTHYIKSLTETELIFTEKEDKDGSYFICERLEWGDLSEAIDGDFEKNIIGRWYSPQYGEETYMQFNADGTGLSVSEVGNDYFRWRIFDGNRLKMVDEETGEEGVTLIEKCDEDCLQFLGIDYVLVRAF